MRLKRVDSMSEERNSEASDKEKGGRARIDAYPSDFKRFLRITNAKRELAGGEEEQE